MSWNELDFEATYSLKPCLSCLAPYAHHRRFFVSWTHSRENVGCHVKADCFSDIYKGLALCKGPSSLARRLHFFTSHLLPPIPSVETSRRLNNIRRRWNIDFSQQEAVSPLPQALCCVSKNAKNEDEKVVGKMRDLRSLYGKTSRTQGQMNNLFYFFSPSLFSRMTDFTYWGSEQPNLVSLLALNDWFFPDEV